MCCSDISVLQCCLFVAVLFKKCCSIVGVNSVAVSFMCCHVVSVL